MADLGTIAGPNGRPAAAQWSIRSSLLWQNNPAWVPNVMPNGFPASAWYSIRCPLTWQSTGPFNALTSLDPNGRPADTCYFIPWYRFLCTTDTPDQRVFDCNGSIYGTVTITGVPTPNARVTLTDGLVTVIACEYTTKAGTYRFDGLPRAYSNYTILVEDPTGQYNLGRLDNMTPV